MGSLLEYHRTNIEATECSYTWYKESSLKPCILAVTSARDDMKVPTVFTVSRNYYVCHCSSHSNTIMSVTARHTVTLLCLSLLVTQ